MDKTFRTAKTYEGAKWIGKSFEKNGKMYQKIEMKCDRCSGLGIIVARVENGQPIPIPVDNGICYACYGTGKFTKEVRLYTEKEYEQMERNNEKARQKKMAEQEKKMKEEYAQKREAWLKRNGFNKNNTTFVVTGETYSIKDELKAKGYKFDSVLKWHKDSIDDEYKDRSVEVKLDDVIEISAWGEGHYKTGAFDYIEKLIVGTPSNSTSDWIGEVGGKIKDLSVTLIKRTSFQGAYGLTNIYNFVDDAGNRLSWFTSTFPQIEEGSKVTITYTSIKKHDEYKGEKITVILRPKFK